MLPLDSGINSRLLPVNHALISPILHHPVLWVALPPSVPSTHHSHHPFTPSLFHSRLKTFLFCKSFPPKPTFSSSALTPRIPRTVYRYFWAYAFLVCSLPVLHCCCSVLQINLTHVGSWTHVRISSLFLTVYGSLVEWYSNHITIRISVQTAGLALGGTGLCWYRVRGVDGSCAKHLTKNLIRSLYR